MPTRPQSRFIGIAGVLLAVALVSGIVIFRGTTSSDPQELYYAAIKSSMMQPGLTCTIEEKLDTSATTQAVRLNLASKSDARALTTLKQQNNTVTTEEITNKSGAYIRYTSISTDQKSAAGAKLDFRTVINVWSTKDLTPGQAGLFGRTALGNCIVPLADLDTAAADKLMQIIRQNRVFAAKFDTVRIESVGSQQVRVYDVTIEPKPYVEFMKQAGETYGLKDLDAVDVATFAGKSAEKLQFFIDVRTSRIQQIRYADKQHSITFSDYGVQPDVNAPKNAISSQELQQRLQSVR